MCDAICSRAGGAYLDFNSFFCFHKHYFCLLLLLWSWAWWGGSIYSDELGVSVRKMNIFTSMTHIGWDLDDR